MTQRVLIVGGSGHIGSAVVRDLHRHTAAHLTVAGRSAARAEALAATLGGRGGACVVDLDTASVDALARLARGFDLVVQCVGPFRLRPPALLLACMAAGVNYVDVCDDKRATQERLGLHESARAAGITALIDTGTFPGIDNVLVADALARCPEATEVNLHFSCAGSGGGGFGVLQTTFIAVSRPYEELRGGQWVTVASYRERRAVDFGPPLGRRPVYSFEVPEIWSLAHTFPRLRTVTSKFGTVPELWNWATMGLAAAPEAYRTDTEFLDRSAQFTLPAVHLIDRWVGEALGIRVEVRGPDGRGETLLFYAPSTTEAVGWATGAAAEMVLSGEIGAPGVLLPETHIPPGPYLERLTARGGKLSVTSDQRALTSTSNQ